ncbi:hypothetical protein CDAR_99051 [Caerostris darwini]|uniref:Secreted protein n=1 Tax=Caerostris darwini TaxID=1538125 RepID=A0AAV4Q4Y1_9ARAC|nr:hypothetical protein CDAR_99051 [Caerostris darwini]
MEWTALSSVVIGYLLQGGRRSCEGDGSAPLSLEIIYKLVGVLWSISEKLYMEGEAHRPFACVNMPESSVTCEAFRPVIGHRGFGSPLRF